jgi:hypothetical protein
MSFLASLNPFRSPESSGNNPPIQPPSGQPYGPGMDKGPNDTQRQDTGQAAQNKQGQAQGQGNGQGQGSDPNAGKTPQEVDPLAAFSKMYENPAAAEKAPVFSLDDKALDGAVAANDFTKGFPPEMMQKATSGDANALMAMMQHVAGQAYKSALSHSATLTGKYSDARDEYNSKGFTSKVQRELTVNALTGTPNFKNPVVRKQLIMIAENIQRQHPDSSPEEIADMSRTYITEMNKAINPSAQSKSSTDKQAPTDWDAYFAQDDS